MLSFMSTFLNLSVKLFFGTMNYLVTQPPKGNLSWKIKDQDAFETMMKVVVSWCILA
jgi:hypothetical protein